MKKVMCLVMVLFFSIVLVCFAQEPSQQDNPGMKKEMMKDQPMKDKMAGAHPGMGMMGMMMPKSMVATSDGGIIVMFANKLFKYDKDLNLQKEVELKIDVDSMQKMMEKKPMPAQAKPNDLEGPPPEPEKEETTFRY